MTRDQWLGWERAAAEQGALDEVDRTLLSTLAAKAGRPEDAALSTVLACLIAAVRAGGLRIPIDPGPLAGRIAEWLNALRGPNAATATFAAIATGAAASADAVARADAPALAARVAEAFTQARLTGHYSAILGTAGAYLPLIEARGGLYFQRHYAAETSVGARLRALLDAPDPAYPPAALSNALVTVLEREPLRRGSGPGAPAMVFEARQREALALALRKRFAIISGGPGTGKTSLAANLLRAWTRLRTGTAGTAPRIRLAAPTGRAAQRLSESLRHSLASIAPAAVQDEPGKRGDDLVRGLECGTLHALLRYQSGSGGFFHHAHRPLPADLVLVDEASMVDIFLFARLLEALEPGACLILMGDMDQLPSVEAGSVLADLAPAGAAAGHALDGHLAVLDRSHRSQQSILQVTHAINAMDAEAALAAMPPPLALSAHPWPIAFRAGDRVECPEGGCRMLLPAPSSC